jgi:hypothetical protein
VPNGTGNYAGNMYKLSNQLYLVDLTGSDNQTRATGNQLGGGARQRLGMLLRVVPLPVDIKAALTIGGPVKFGGGNVFIDGNDRVPPSWPGCGPLEPTLAGVRAKNAGDVAASQGQVKGNPNTLIDPTMDTTTFMNYGGTTYDQLAAAATIQLPGGVYSPAPNPATNTGTCTASNLNWGDGINPTFPCGNYFPIVHFAGNATINNGQGQGILLVDGNLIASGTFTYYGIVIVRGGFSTVAGGNPKVYGSVLAQSLNLATTAFAGDAVVEYSSCSVAKTMDATGSASMFRSRSWVRLQ